WEETALLACGMTQNPAAFVAGLADTNLVLAARCALELAATGRAGQIALGPLQHRLLERSRDPNCDLRARIAAARALGELGDPRFERRTGKFGDYLLPPRVNIPAGDYPLGSDEGIEADEAPAHRVPVAAFALARFQVTNAEWKCFMEGGGYENVRWWQGEAAARWQRGDGVADGPKQQQREVRQFLRSKPGHIDALLAERRITSEQARDWRKWYIDMGDEEFDVQLDDWYPSGIRREPAQWNDPSFNHAAQPVVGICWHEARAYCAWLSAQTGQFWRLPSEAEWEGAAAGLAARRFAWGNEFDTSRCNSFESHVRGTTPVGVFPAGDTPDGLADLSGNVWEWTGSAYRPYRYVAADGRENSEDGELLRVVRGGSWVNYRDRARCTFRLRLHPGVRFSCLGFRVLCVSPIF
ncbi:MAG: SUMF1/EgtB/PvdO family nonheme iron enzyme, partial [Rhodocyclaceae bacterium]|nr:SUMF1/EgtB/PvdO family nonheme iron enzyme [Rhodocyclaceae bacterium]